MTIFQKKGRKEGGRIEALGRVPRPLATTLPKMTVFMCMAAVAAQY